ncbi:hypothetical protein QBC43DRAFT_330725 [Cladorrhinum sp. PSN259]|nr:hypothetical protein QBC43DRAFT_330725 [Cladorrhinum sp. PSN259]
MRGWQIDISKPQQVTLDPEGDLLLTVRRNGNDDNSKLVLMRMEVIAVIVWTRNTMRILYLSREGYLMCFFPKLGSGCIERIHVTEQFHNGSVASMSDLFLLRVVKVVDRGGMINSQRLTTRNWRESRKYHCGNWVNASQTKDCLLKMIGVE